MPFLFLSSAEITKFLTQLHGLEIIAGLDGSLQVGRRESLLAPLYRQRSLHIIIGGAPFSRRGVKDALHTLCLLLLSTWGVLSACKREQKTVESANVTRSGRCLNANHRKNVLGQSVSF